MIDFTCRCGHAFSLPESDAGSEVQCPGCHLLRDVPTRSDLINIDEQGDYFIGHALAPHEPTEQRVEEVKRAFTAERFDEFGDEIDMRLQFEDALLVGKSETQSTAANVAIDRPQYNPFTGELVRPMEIDHNSLPSSVEQHAEPATPVLSYARIDLPREIAFYEIPGKLIEPINIFVMLIVLFGHVLLQGVSAILAGGLFVAAPIWILFAGLILGQYANTVEEIGPAEMDELPRPLRDFEFHADLWKPFTNAAGAAILAFAPVLIAIKLPAPDVVQLVVCLAAIYAFPAIFLTAVTSGSTPNLRPDRVWSVVRACGMNYWTLFALFFATVFLYGLGFWRLQADTLLMLASKSKSTGFQTQFPWWFSRGVTYPALFAGLFMMHWFLWTLALAYREFHPRFNWIFQRHEPVRFLERIGKRKRQTRQPQSKK